MTSPDENQQRPLLGLHRLDELVGVFAIVAVVLSVLWGVVSRYVLPQPAAWTYEVAVIAFAYLVFFGAVAGVRLGSHAAVDVLTEALPTSAQRAIDWFNYFLLAALFLTMTALFVQQAIISHRAHTVALNLPRSIVFAPLALASLGMLVQHLWVERPWVRRGEHRHVDPIL